MRPSSASSQSPGGGTQAAKVLEELPQLLDRSKVLQFLETYGYIARDPHEWWESPLPELTLQVKGHEKVGKHSYYQVDCSLAKRGQWHSPYLSWRSSLRLSHFRAGLHDCVKRELGDVSYKQCFDGVHFAHRLAPNGTTARLDAWCRRLASTINAKQATPTLAAFALQLLGVPDSVASAEAGSGAGDASRSLASSPCVGAREGDAAAPDDLNPFSGDLEQEEEARPPRFTGGPVFSGA
eukprot:CAMPEP_0204539100 /NCGR_PEP_ID=MMETSP0661-20131031/16487_1 /ASSEMBLY_ACC=CAM_ASM_000606 /TAXON_ID=109239 /ORGANISM="Alexandrium margalefi, Strain AMGDE01CS-322" /LENGTH=237 /DNA_ID=CAMNT_0051545699 /DNA_START=35 /DNA_END=744 /DNA_ORIENTATION=-